MFWQLHPGAVIGGQASEAVPMTSEDRRNTGRTWPSPESSNRAKYTREYVLRDWGRFSWRTGSSSERPFIHRRIHIRKPCSPTPMTVPDKIDGWEDEEKWLGSRLAACMWIHTKVVLCDEQESTQEYLAPRLISIKGGVNLVCDVA